MMDMVVKIYYAKFHSIWRTGAGDTPLLLTVSHFCCNFYCVPLRVRVRLRIHGRHGRDVAHVVDVAHEVDVAGDAAVNICVRVRGVAGLAVVAVVVAFCMEMRNDI